MVKLFDAKLVLIFLPVKMPDYLRGFLLKKEE